SVRVHTPPMVVTPPTPKFVCLAALALMVGLLTPTVVFAAQQFPRGPGFYFDPYKLFALIVNLLLWVKLCAWVDLDAHHYEIDAVRWNSMLLGAGFVGFLLIWIFAGFWLAALLFWIIVGSPAFWYITVRNRKAPAEERLLTK